MNNIFASSLAQQKLSRRDGKRITGSSDGSGSLYLPFVYVFLSHGLCNAILLSPMNNLRCLYWNRICNDDEYWILNWLAFGKFHFFVLLTCLARSAHGNMILEARMACLCAAIIMSYVSSGIFLLDDLNKPLATLQVFIYIGLLVALVFRLATAPPIVPLPMEIRSSSFDYRLKLPIASIAIAIQFLLSLFQLIDMTFGSGRDGYLGDSSGRVYHLMSSAAVCQMLWISCILGGSVFLATVDQQRAVLAGHAVALFVSLTMLTGTQGTMMEPQQLQAGTIATFFSMALSLLGAY